MRSRPFHPIGLFVAAMAVLLTAEGIPAAVDTPVATATDEELRNEVQRRLEERTGVTQPDGERPGTRTKGSLSRFDEGALLEAVRAETRVTGRGIYGADEPKDWYQINDPAVKALARASVALVDSADTLAGSVNEVRLKARPLQQAVQGGLCPDEAFAQQPSAAFCSGTLVRPDMVLTAGHCIREISGNSQAPPISSVKFLFGYWLEGKTSDVRTLPAAQVFAGKEVLAGQMSEISKPQDWALVRLERPVPADLAEPVTAWDTTPISKGTKVFVLGFPGGIPLKYAPGAEVRDITNPTFFVANLDTFGGNSGSGVYDQTTKKLLGILVRGEADYVRDQRKNCERVNVCPKSGCRGEDVTRISLVPQP
jgi:Trypsin-like peptidase domain